LDGAGVSESTGNPYAAPGRLCEKCQAPIKFVKTERGSTLPIDAVASDCHNPLAEYHRLGTSFVVRHVRHAEDRCSHARLYVSHFRTCPYAGSFGKGRNARVVREEKGPRQEVGVINQSQSWNEELDALYRIKMEQEP
jgi:hypothetical protein